MRVAVLAASLLAVAVSPASAAFSDVPPGRFYTEPVEWMAEQEITTGTSPTTFEPDASMTRGQFATFLWRFAGEPFGTSNPFADVPSGQFYTEAVKWMADTEITTGTSPTTFEPNATVTRGQVATFLWRYMCTPSGSSNPFTDVPSGRFYTEAVKWMVDNEITTGTTPTTFSPDANVTRGQFATFLWRLASEPDAVDPGANRVTLAPDCDGTPPPPPPGVGSLSAAAALAFGSAGVHVDSEMSITISHSGSTGAPNLTVTGVELSDDQFSATFTPVNLGPGESTDIDVVVNPDALGSVTGTLSILHSGTNGPSTDVSLTATGVPGEIHRINVGGAAVSGWTSDSLASPSAFHNVGTGASNVFATTDPITGAGATPSAVFQSARRDFASNTTTMQWDLPVPEPGSYLVNLYFAEIANLDKQDVLIEEMTVLRDLDVAAEASGDDTALVRSFVVDVVGDLDIDFDHAGLLAATYVNGIEVLSLGASPQGYLSIAPSHLDLGSIATSGGANVETVVVQNLGSTSVTIPSIAASGDFSTSVSSLVVPAGATRTFDVTFDPTADGRQSQWLELETATGDATGIHLWGHGGAGKAASVTVLANTNGFDATVFAPGSFAIHNDSATASIKSVSFDLGGAILDGLRFDLSNGSVIAEDEKSFTSDYSDVVVTGQSASDGSTLDVTVSGFGPGDSLFGSVDIDPVSTTGMTGSDARRVGPTSGLELAGATITVTYTDDTTATATLWSDGTDARSEAVFFQTAGPGSPGIGMAGPIADGTAGLVAAAQTIDVTCSGTEDLQLLQMHASLDTIGATGGATPIGGNRASDFVALSAVESCAGGTASFAVTLHDETASDSSDGWNHFMVLQGDPSTDRAEASARFSVQLVT